MLCFDEKNRKNKEEMRGQSKNKGKGIRGYCVLSTIYCIGSSPVVWILRNMGIAAIIVLDINSDFVIGCFPCLNDCVVTIVQWFNGLYGNQGDIISVASWLWAFTTAMSCYYMEKLDRKYYGIRLSDILLSDKGIFSIALIVISIAVDPLLLLFSEMFNWFYTSVVVAILQFFSMIFAILMIYTETSKYVVIEKIRKQDAEQLNENNQLFVNFFKNADYFDDYEVDLVMEYLIKDVPEEFTNLQDRVNEVVSYIFDSEQDLDKRFLFVKNWLSQLNDVENIDEEKKMKIRKGIFLALIKKIHLRTASKLLEFLDLCNQETSELVLWCAACNIYFEQYEMQEWRKPLTRNLLRYRVGKRSLDEDKKLLLLYREVYDQIHDQYSGKQSKNYDKFLRVFEYCINM